MAPLKINVGGNTIMTKVKAPVIKRTPRGNEGTSTATFPLTKMYVANVTADNKPKMTPVVSKAPADCSSKPLDKNVPTSKKITEITFSLEGNVFVATASMIIPTQTNWNKRIIAIEAGTVFNEA